MKKTRVIIGVSFILILILGIPFLYHTHHEPYHITSQNYNIPKSSADSPIQIVGNDQISTYASSGDGSEGNPWIIEDYIIETELTSGDGTNFGIYIEGTTAHTIIQNCSVNWGIKIKSCINITLYNNTFIHTEGITIDGIRTQGSTRNCTIDNNIISGYSNGIHLDTSDRMDIKHNIIYDNNDYGIKVSDIWVDLFEIEPTLGNAIHHNFIYDNGFNTQTTPPTSSGIYATNTHSLDIYSNHIYENYESGIHLYNGCENVTIYDNMINKTTPQTYGVISAGIDVVNSEDIYILNNDIVHNDDSIARGIELTSSSSCNISHNNISHNSYGIFMSGSSNNIIENNTFDSNGDGVQTFVSSNYNTINKNHFLNGGDDGIHISASEYNNITRNHIHDMTDVGIFLASSEHNLFYLNIFENNGEHVDYNDESDTDQWDYARAGNSWDNYFSQNPSAEDVGDVWSLPYHMSDYNIYDYYPLVRNYTYPTSQFSRDSLVVFPDEEVQFFYEGYSDEDPTTFEWDFGDGSLNSTDKNPTHTYTTKDTFTVTLKVTDGGNDVSYHTQDILVEDDIVPDFTIVINSTDRRERIPIHFEFDGEDGNSPATYMWDFGDGETSSVQNPTHTYDLNGTYLVKLNVTDANGDSLTKQTYITIENNLMPVASFSVDSTSIAKGTMLNFTFDGTLGDGLTRFRWNFGDNSPFSTEYNPSHNFTASGTYNVTLTITDSDGDVSVYTMTITVYEPNPPKEPISIWVWIMSGVGGIAVAGGIGYSIKKNRKKEALLTIEQCGSDEYYWDGFECIPIGDTE